MPHPTQRLLLESDLVRDGSLGAATGCWWSNPFEDLGALNASSTGAISAGCHAHASCIEVWATLRFL